MAEQMIDYGDGVFAIDAGYIRPRFAAIHLLVDDGRAAFIDTGINASLPQVQAALAAVGLTPAAVDYVIVTHVHLDHAGGAGAMMQAFAAARLVVHPRGARHMIDPSKLLAATREVYGAEQTQQLYGDLPPVAAERVIATSEGMTLSLGRRTLTIHEAPGHAKHQNFIHDHGANVIFSGDAFGMAFPELDVDGQPLIFPATTPSQFDPVDMRDSVERMIALKPHAIHPTHFMRFAPPPQLAAILLRRMDDFVRLARSAAASDDAAQTLRRTLGEFMLGEARAHGVVLADEQILDLLHMDIELNAQGLLHWLAQKPQ